MIVCKLRTIGTLFLMLIACLSASTEAQTVDLATLRIQIDVDSASLVVDTVEVTTDAFGSPLTRNAPFILNLPAGLHSLVFSHPRLDTISQSIELISGEVRVLEISFLAIDTAAGPPSVEIVSLPDSGRIRIDDSTVASLTPHSLEVEVGERLIQVSRDGYEPLTHSMTFLPGQRFVLDFNLMAIPPVEMTADSLGLSLMPQILLDSPERADILKRKYTSLSETFFIIPFVQGIAGRSLLSEKDRPTADIMIISGAVLVVGTYLAGKLLSKRLRARIEVYNETARIENSRAKENNRNVQREVRRVNEAAVQQWQMDNMDKGEVIVTPVTSPLPSDTVSDTTAVGTTQ